MLKNRIVYFLWYGLFWILFFLILRLFFIIANWQLVHGISLINICKTFRYGIVMDLSAMGYLLIIPGFVLFVSYFSNKRWIKVFINTYTFILLLIISFLAITDATLYKFWGFRLDSTPLLYLKTPKEAFASVSVGFIILQLLIGFLLFAAFLFIFKKWFKPSDSFKIIKPIYSPAMILAIALLIIPIRGGFGIAPMNVGTVYFSNIQFLNHTAINLFWNVGFSLIENQGIKNNYNYFEPKELAKYKNEFTNHNLPADSIVLTNPKPNIVILILESFTAKIIEPLGGKKGIAPEINKLCSEGLLFTNFYANGDRSDKGLIGVLSGYPAQTTTSIIKYTSKTRSLPRLGLSLQQHGYFTAFYYGGDINFANMRSYLLDSKYNEIISEDSFPVSTYNSKWGAQDQFLFNKLNNKLQHTPQPFFISLFTLSSHEPFEVPGKNMKGENEESRYLNAIHYTDSCVGDFIRKAKNEPWWNNTLIVLVADHGHRFPGLSGNSNIRKYKIPMLWLGGALRVKGTISKYASQTDIPATLLSQLGITSKDYQYSKNIIGKQHSFAYYIFNNGFGILKDSSACVFDCSGNRAIFKSGPKSSQIENIGKAYIQDIYTDIENR